MPAIFSHLAMGRVPVGRAALQVLCWWVPCPPRGTPVGCSPGAAPAPGSVPAAGITHRLFGSQLSVPIHLPVTLALRCPPPSRGRWLCHRSRHIPTCPSLLPLRAELLAAREMVMGSTGLLPNGEIPEKCSREPIVAASCCLPGSRQCPGTALPSEPSTGPASGLPTGMETSKTSKIIDSIQ